MSNEIFVVKITTTGTPSLQKDAPSLQVKSLVEDERGIFIPKIGGNDNASDQDLMLQAEIAARKSTPGALGVYNPQGRPGDRRRF